jgi:two-component system response regulator (stage 0 sporulation protein A)
MADDNQLLCKIVANYLATQPKIELIDTAHDGLEAVEKIKHLKPQVVLLDCAMPMLDGIGVLEKLHEDNAYFPVCIMLSGIRHDAVTKRAYDLGAVYYIIKPFDLDVLAERILMFSSFAVASVKNESAGSVSSILSNDIRDKFEIRQEILPDQNEYQTAILESPMSQEEPIPLAAQSISSSSDVTLEGKVTNLLHEIGVPANIRGYRCLRTAIIITVDNLDLLHFVTKELYPAIAKELGTTPSSVERAIRHAITLVWDRGNKAALTKLFGYPIETRKKKPSNSEFIALIADKFRLENRMG